MEQSNVQINQTNMQGANIYSNAKFLELVTKAEENKSKATAYVGEVKLLPKVAEGQYFAITTDAQHILNKQTSKGQKKCVQVNFAIFLPSGFEPVELSMLYWEPESNTAEYVKQLSILLGSDASKGFEIRNLIGKYCLVKVKHKTSQNGNIFANIEELSLQNPPSNLTNSINL